MSSIEDICREYSLSVVEVFTAGHVCPAVYKAQDCTGTSVVIKVGNNLAAIQEIEKNLEGYSMLDKIGLGYICPYIYNAEVTSGSAVIIMEYCGDDFYSLLEKVADPVKIFRELVPQLGKIYQDSVMMESPAKSIKKVLSKVVEQYNMYLATVFDCKGQLQLPLEALPSRINVEAFKLSCFSSWDFTPRNVSLTKNGLKYFDCNGDVLGVPIVDLACFAGVARDAYFLPGSVSGYDLLEELAVGEVAGILQIDSVQAQRLFCLGRLLQLFLGARFRIKSDPVLAKKLYEDAVGFLRKITD